MIDWSQIETGFGPHVWRIAYSVLRNYDDASDCYQDVFVELFEMSQKAPIDIQLPLLKWLAVRRSIDRLRRKQRTLPDGSTGHHPMLLVSDESEPSSKIEMEELVAVLRGELGKLSNKQSEVFWLRCIEELSYEEIALQMGIERNEVGVLLHRTRRHLQDVLSDRRAEFFH